MRSLIVDHLRIMADQAKTNGDALGESTLRTAAERLERFELADHARAPGESAKAHLLRCLTQESGEAHNDLDLLGITRHGPASDGTGPTTLTLHGRLVELRRRTEAAVVIAREVLEAMKAVEWAGQTDDEDGGYVDACPSCGAEEDDGHNGGCKLAAAIAMADRQLADRDRTPFT